jgi:hypothetical protein
MFNREDFKASQVSSLKEEDKKVSKMLGNQSKEKVDYIRLEGGRNIIRIMPAHPSPNNNIFVESKITTILPILVPERDANGDVIKDVAGKEKMRETVKNIFNAKVHGGFAFDIVEEYITRAIQKADKLYASSSKEKTHFLRFIYGNYDARVKENNIFPINYQHKWMMYVKKLNIDSEKFEYGKLEIGKAVKNRLNEIAAMESENQPITTDPFSDPDAGIPVSITYNKDASSPNDYYKVDLYMPRTGNTFKTFPLTDEDLTWLSEQEPLAKQFQGAYRRRDFELQLEGLQRIDVKSGYDIFSDNSFLRLVEEMSDMLPEDNQQESEKKDAAETEKPKQNVEESAQVKENAPKVETNAEVKTEAQDNDSNNEEDEELNVEERMKKMREKFLKGGK